MADKTDPAKEFDDLANAIPLTEVPNLLPRRRGKKTHCSTVYRWATQGTRGRILKSKLVGGIRYTTHEALQCFLNGSSLIIHRSDYDIAIDRILTKKGK